MAPTNEEMIFQCIASPFPVDGKATAKVPATTRQLPTQPRGPGLPEIGKNNVNVEILQCNADNILLVVILP